MQENSWEKFHNAAREGRVDTLKEMLEKKEIDIDATNEAGMTGLMIACCCYRGNAIRFFIENGANDELKNVHGMTAREILVQSDVPELGLEKIFDDAKRNRLTTAAQEGNLDAVKRMIKLGDDVNGVDMVGDFPLICASGSGHLEVVKHLAVNGAEIDKANEYGMTPLMSAVCRFEEDCVSYLIEQGADEKRLNVDGRSAETMARRNIVDVIKDAVKKRDNQKVLSLTRNDGFNR